MDNSGARFNYTGNSAAPHATQHNGNIYGNVTNTTSDSAAIDARQHNGNVYNNTTYSYNLRKRRSDETLRENDRNATFLKAAANGQTRRLEYLLRIGADIEYTDQDDLTALHHAALSGFEDAVEALIAAGSDLDACSRSYGTPLCLAALKGRKNIMGLLLKARANINAESGWLGSALHCACASKDLSVVEVLLSNSAAVSNACTVQWDVFLKLLGSAEASSFGCSLCTPIAFAARYSTPAVIQILIEAGANVDEPSRWWTILQAGHMEASDSAAQQRLSCTPLSWSCSHGLVEHARVLLDSGADPNIQDNQGFTTLHIAAYHGEPDCIELLMGRGASLDLLDRSGRTPLHIAVGRGSISCVRKLIGSNMGSEARHLNGATPLRHTAGLYGSAVQLNLLQVDALLHAQDRRGYTALHLVCDSGNLEYLQLLISCGAQLNTQTHSKETPLHLAARNGLSSCVRELILHGVDIEARDDVGRTSLHGAAANGHHETIQALLGKLSPMDNSKSPTAGADIEAEDFSGHTALHLAASEGHDDAVRVLLDAGANIEASKNANSWTPLHIAAYQGRKLTMTVLLAAGANEWSVSSAGLRAQQVYVERWSSITQSKTRKGRFGGWIDMAKALTGEQNTTRTDAEVSQEREESNQDTRQQLASKVRLGPLFTGKLSAEEQRDIAFEETRRTLESLIDDMTIKDDSSRPLFLPRGEARRLFIQNQKLVRSLCRYSIHSENGIRRKQEEFLFWKAVVAPDVASDEYDQARSNILASLLKSIVTRRDNAWLKFLNLCLSSEGEECGTIQEQDQIDVENVYTTTRSESRDRDLPLDRDAIEEFFGRHIVETLSLWQGRYCPIVLKENTLIEVNKSRTVPFMGRQFLGAGSGGKVYRVTVPRSHFVFHRHNAKSTNQGDIHVAEKIMQANDSSRTAQHKDEWNTIQQFLKYTTRHRGIIAVFASIDRGTELSIVSEYAEYGDLWNYMMNGTHQIEDPKWRQHILEQMRDVADGLNHMHSGFMDKSDKIMCSHLYLTPSKVLITRGDCSSATGCDLVFKIADFGHFGVSRRKENSSADEQLISPFANFSHPAIPDQRRATHQYSSLDDQRREFTDCYAPELLELERRATDKVDIWAYGCILAMVIVWMYGGNGLLGIDNFRRYRAEKILQITRIRGIYWFFVHVGAEEELPGEYFKATIDDLEGPTLRRLYLNPSVTEWFDRLRRYTQDQPDHFILDTIGKLLSDRILVPVPTMRCNARELFERMDRLMDRLVARPHQLAHDAPDLVIR